MKRRRLLAALSVVVAVAVVVAGMAFFLHNNGSKRSTTMWKTEGPRVLAHVNLIGGASAFISSFNSFQQLTQQFNDVSAQMFVYSPMPDSLARSGATNLTAMNQTSNQYEVQLFNGTSNQTGVFSGYLSSQFYTIVKEWTSILSSSNMSRTTNVSLELDAVLQYVSGSQFTVYQFYNNIPFDPFDSALQQPVNYLVSDFNTSIYFDLSRPPMFTYPVNTSVSAQSVANGHRIIGGSCSGCTDTSTVVYTNTTASILPLLINNMTQGQNSGAIVSNYRINANLQLSFNSNSGTAKLENEIVGFPVMSEQPSWSAEIDGTAAFGGPTPQTQTNLQGYNISALGIPATIHVVRYKYYYFACYNQYCEFQGNSYRTSVSITDSPTYNATAEYMVNMKDSPFWGDVLGSMGFSPVGAPIKIPINTAPPPSLNLTDSVSAYSNVASIEQHAVSAASTFIAYVGAGLAIAAAASALPLTGTAADAILAVNVALSGAALALALMSAFSSVSFSANIGLSTTLVGFANGALPYTSGTTLYAQELESSTTTTLTTSAGSNSANVPSIFFNINT